SSLVASPGWLLIGLVALALAAGPRLAGAAAANWAAVGQMTPCGHAPGPARPAAAPDMPGVDPAQRAWLQAAQARCRGDAAASEAALQATLAISPAQLEIARAIAPQDRPLAETAAAHYPDNAAAQLWLADARAAASDSAGAISAYERGL